MLLEDALEKRHNEVVRVALDTSFAGVNPTGVGLYSRRLLASLSENQARLGLDLRCYGAACRNQSAENELLALTSEWPTYTHLALPLRLLRHKPNIVHSTSHIGPIWGPGKLIVTVHDLIFRRFPEDYDPLWLSITKLTLPLVLRRASMIIADSQATRRDLQIYYRVRSGKIAVVYPGVDSEYARNRQKNKSSRYILCLGPWVKRKNLEVVLNAFALLSKDIPDLKLVITGKPSSGMKGYTEQELLGAFSAEFRSRVQLAGYVATKELAGLVAGATVLAYPSRWEGFGLPPLEAMSAGVLVVASNTPAVAEVTGGAAVLCDPDEPGEWAAAIRCILDDPTQYQELVERGLKRSATFTWEKCAEETARLYHIVAANRRNSIPRLR